MKSDAIKKLNIPDSSGCYQFFNKKGELIYIGKASNLKSRVSSYFSKSAGLTPAKARMVCEIEKIEWIETDSEIEALLLESNLIKKHQPPYNILLRDDKRFAYVKISLSDEVPGVFMTRKIDKAGKYFGPFVSAQAVRETLKAVRKVWPYCTERSYKKKPCFYYQINLCTGVCGRIIDRKAYLEDIIRPITLFFEGKKKKIITDYRLQITNLKKKIKKPEADNIEREKAAEESGKLEFRLLNINRVLEHADILGVGEKYANDVVELAKVLRLKKIPERIEGYDIANIFGREAVGSMVVFAGGEADKNEYRKFKIKIGEGLANDVRMLKEVLERRLKRVPLIRGIKGVNEGENNPNPPYPPYQGGDKENWPLPDLIIIDGGKAQLNAALSVLKKNKLDIQVISISKGDGLRSSIAKDKIFFPGEKKPLELPLASPALHLIKRVRDEAHRFAIAYHKKLRGKKFFK